MEQVRSVDGTAIAFTRHGDGDPVLLVHGGPSSGEAWAQVVPHLPDHTVVTMDRRGRGASSDGAAYSLDLEAADVAAVIGAFDEPVHLVGHSSGAVVALRAAARTPALRSLALYEPPVALHRVPRHSLDRVEELVRIGDDDAAAGEFFATIAATESEVALLRSHPPVWDRLVASMPVAPREIHALATTPLDLDAVGQVVAPVLLLVGELTTAPVYLDGLDELQDAFLDVRRRTVPGQRHLANAFAPQVLAELIGSFLASVEQADPAVGGSPG